MFSMKTTNYNFRNFSRVCSILKLTIPISFHTTRCSIYSPYCFTTREVSITSTINICFF